MALVVILYGAIESFVAAIWFHFSHGDGHRRREIWLRFARWLVAGLTFQLAADIIETSMTPSWDGIGRLAAIAVVRTFLNYFLERDLAEVRGRQGDGTEEKERAA
ncbi:DUF1622 domain-containing protein [Mesorhizobium sp. YR577]|uniref:DUF1622 domain-containing protein n=1 Tax=Mesorhizobium sp. YR577 TaxID=1884373 RepID=UPI001FCCFB86|nr:DUF1622 domain-containing protein [Mesorhizobium sp. YR577]